MQTVSFQEMFELRYAKMPEEPPAPPAKSMLLKPSKGGMSEGSEQSHSDSEESSSSDDSESESERANQLSYLQKQVSLFPCLLEYLSPLSVPCVCVGDDCPPAAGCTSWRQNLKEAARS